MTKKIIRTFGEGEKMFQTVECTVTPKNCPFKKGIMCDKHYPEIYDMRCHMDNNRECSYYYHEKATIY